LSAHKTEGLSILSTTSLLGSVLQFFSFLEIRFLLLACEKFSQRELEQKQFLETNKHGTISIYLIGFVQRDG
jgi:hypothetical protein